MSIQSVVKQLIAKRTAWLHEIATQDNRATAHPIIIKLQREKKYPARDGYDSDGEWKAKEEENLTEDVPYKIHWEDYQHFFTYSGLEDHLRINRHNVGPHRSYVDHAFRNREWDSIPKDFKVLIEYIQDLEAKLPAVMQGMPPDDFEGWWLWWSSCKCGHADFAKRAASNAWHKQQHKIDALEAELKLLKEAK